MNRSKTLEEEFDNIYCRYISNIEYIAYNYLYNREEAEDVAQEVFTAFWNNIEHIDLKGNIFSYLYVSARNFSLRRLNLIKLQNKHSEFIDSRGDLSRITALESTANKLYEVEIETLLADALEKMSKKTKEAYQLSRNKEMSYKQIALLQNVSEKNIEYRISSALRILREVFRDYLIYLIYINV